MTFVRFFVYFSWPMSYFVLVSCLQGDSAVLFNRAHHTLRRPFDYNCFLILCIFTSPGATAFEKWLFSLPLSILPTVRKCNSMQTRTSSCDNSFPTFSNGSIFSQFCTFFSIVKLAHVDFFLFDWFLYSVHCKALWWNDCELVVKCVEWFVLGNVASGFVSGSSAQTVWQETHCKLLFIDVRPSATTEAFLTFL